jgi:type IV secretion system protein VirD4
VRELPDETAPVQVLVILDEFARLGRASVIASAFSYVAGYGIRLLPVIQSRSQLRGVYGEHVADEIVANCGVEVAFTPKELRVANDLSERLGYVGQESVTRSLTINGWLANRSKSTSEQRRALMLPQELMQFPPGKLILLRGGIPPIIGTKIAWFSNRFFKARAFAPPDVPALTKATRNVDLVPVFRDMTDAEAAGHDTRPMSSDDVLTEDCPSFFADILTLDQGGNVCGLIEEGDENG